MGHCQQDRTERLYVVARKKEKIALVGDKTNLPIARFIYDKKRSFVLNIGESYIFSDGLKVSLDKIEGSVPENYRRVYLTIEESDEEPTERKDTLRKIEESDEEPTERKDILIKILNWFGSLF